jgi:hypothetical protein
MSKQLKEVLMKGLLTEDIIVARIELKCDIKREPAYDHVYKLDFIVDRFKNIAKLIPVGVQITTRLDDITKMRNFLLERRKKTLVDRSIYIEVHPDVDINNWGAELIYNALVSFVFENRLREKDILGVRIKPDVTYEFFDLEESIKQRQETHNGKIFRYFPDKGYGFIEVEDKGNWYFDRTSIKDSNLKEKFLAKVKIKTENNNLVRPIYVVFEDGGYVKNSGSAPLAINVRLSKLKN